MSREWNKQLQKLIKKQHLPTGEIAILDAVPKLQTHGKEFVLLPWRIERRFVELKNLIDNATLESVSTLRFASMTANDTLFKQIGRELDLAVWLMKSSVRSLFATCVEDVAANLIVKLTNDVSVGIECGNKLPKGSETIDRHEIIARRGVASDRVVDTQVPQSSIYVFTSKNTTRYTDIDAELFGLSEVGVHFVRAALAVLENPSIGEEWNIAAKQIEKWIAAVKQSHATTRMVTL